MRLDQSVGSYHRTFRYRNSSFVCESARNTAMETEAAEIRRSIEEATADLFDIEERKVRHRAEQLQARLKAVEGKSEVTKNPAVGE